MSGFEQRVVKILSDAQEVIEDFNKEAGEPCIEESLKDLHERLLKTRAVQTYLNESFITLTRIRSAVYMSLTQAKFNLDKAVAESVTKKIAPFDDYSSAQTQNAIIISKTIDERIKVSELERFKHDIDSAVEIIKSRHFESGRAVRDIETRIKILTSDMEGRFG